MILTIVFRTPLASKGNFFMNFVAFWFIPSTDTTSTSTKSHLRSIMVILNVTIIFSSTDVLLSRVNFDDNLVVKKSAVSL
mmetsp:Transcript_7587/g.17736  ORF Transcript_7587/g.17736 Transcript_7587/m.17736 type:complete len:80 (-) Transcript_7587:137-376(-)